MARKYSGNSQNKFIQLLSLAILLLGLGTSALLAQQKLNDSRAAVSAPPPPVCPSGQFFCGGCVNGCVNTGGKTCNQYIAERCQTGSTCAVGQKRCSGNTVQTCLPPGSWANTQNCSSGQSCVNGNCQTSSGGTKTPSPAPKTPTPPVRTYTKICPTLGVTRCSNGQYQECTALTTETDTTINEKWDWTTTTYGTQNGITAAITCGTSCPQNCTTYNANPRTTDGKIVCFCPNNVKTVSDECTTLGVYHCETIDAYNGNLYVCDKRAVITNAGQTVEQKYWKIVPTYTCGRLACPGFANNPNLKTQEGLPACPKY